VVAGTLGAAATVVVAMPLTTLFRESAWLPGAMLGVAVVALTGMLLRSVTGRTGVTVLGQLLVTAFYVLVTQLGGTTIHLVVPTPRTAPRLLAAVRDAQETITTFAAPAPETFGVTVVLVIIIIVVGLAVDMSAA